MYSLAAIFNLVGELWNAGLPLRVQTSDSYFEAHLEEKKNIITLFITST